MDSNAVARGEEIYERELRAKLEATDRGRYVIINAETGEYIIRDTPQEAISEFCAQFPETQGYIVQIGVPLFA